MKRVDCEKCVHSNSIDADKLRCRLKKCQPEYEDMREAREALVEAFPGSFINDNDEFIADVKSNQYFICVVNQKDMKGCGECEHIPCDIWRKTKDPAFTEEEFERNIQERVDRLKKG